MSTARKSQPFVRTPRAIAGLLARWALRSAGDHVLDMGFGEGTFLLESARCLQALGASAKRLTDQLHGIDSRSDAAPMLRQVFNTHGLPTDLRGILTTDFFSTSLPPVDAIIGHPPSGRHWQRRDVDAMRAAVETLPEAGRFSRLTDPQCFFVIHSAQFLKPGGRLALIIADSWLDMRYGAAFKDYLLRTFVVRGVLGFQTRIFRQVRVRPVVLLAEKRTASKVGKHQPVAFVFFTGSIPNDLPHDPCELLDAASPRTDGTILPLAELNQVDAVALRPEGVQGAAGISRPDALGLPGTGTPRPANVCQDVLRRAAGCAAALAA